MGKKDKWNSEEEMLVSLEDYLQKQGWDVYKEVSTPYGPIDFVASRVIGKFEFKWGIEGKLQCSSKLAEQANYKKRFFHMFSVAIPTNVSFLAEFYLNHNGIGVLKIDKHESSYREESYSVEELLKPKLNRKKSPIELFPEQLINNAGAQHGEMTGFQRSIQEVKRYLFNNGPSEIKDIVESIDHHYHSTSSAKAQFKKAMTSFGGICDDFKREGYGKKSKYILTDDAQIKYIEEILIQAVDIMKNLAKNKKKLSFRYYRQMENLKDYITNADSRSIQNIPWRYQEGTMTSKEVDEWFDSFKKKIIKEAKKKRKDNAKKDD